MSLSLVKKIWSVLFGLSLLCFIWIFVQFSKELYHYFQLSAIAPIEILEWTPEEMGKDRYGSVVNYSFQLGQEIREGFYRFEKPLFPNQAACVRSIEELQNKPWHIFYNAKDPTIASLQRPFPFKKSIHSLLSLAVLLYFLWFRDYLVKLLPDSEKELSPGDSVP